MLKIKFVSASIVLISLSGFTAHADPGNCDSLEQPVSVPYVIAVETSVFTPLSQKQFRFATALAAETWNEQSNGMYFVYSGDYLGTQICTQKQIDGKVNGYGAAHPPSVYQTMCPESSIQVDCSQIPNSGLLVGIQNRYGAGEYRPNVFCSGTVDKVGLNALVSLSNSSQRPYDTGIPSNIQNDPIYTLIHEIGHHIGYSDHPNSDEGTQMVSNAWPQGSVARDLWEWDRKCNDNGTRRSLSGYRRVLTSGSFSSEQKFTNTWNFTHMSPGVSHYGGSTQYNAIGNGPTDIQFSNDIYGFSADETVDYSSINYTSSAAQSIRSLRFRGTNQWTNESLDEDYIVYSSQQDYENSDRGKNEGRHRMRYIRSNDGFSSVISRGYLKVCTNMTSWASCSSEFIYSAKPMSLAYNDQLGVSVAAWVNQVRGQTSHARRNDVAIAAGMVSHDTLGKKQWLDIKSAVTPAIACKDSNISSRDCFVAYVDFNDGDGDVEIVRFNMVSDSSLNMFRIVNRVVVDSPTGLSNIQTASGMTAWYHNGYYYLAVKSLEAGMPVRVFRSTWNGGQFTEVTVPGGFGTTVAGPEAVSHWQGNNILMTVR